MAFEIRESGWPSAVRMRIVRVEREVVVAHQFAHRRQGHLVAPAGNKEIRLEVLGWATFQKRVFGVARELPMLLHALQPVG